jgi:tetratricopeptide (TPR) repeat protein
LRVDGSVVRTWVPNISESWISIFDQVDPEALQSRESLAAVRKSIFGEEQPETVILLGYFARTCSQVDRAGEASERAEWATIANQKSLGEEHPTTLMSMNSLAMALDTLGCKKEAERVYRKTLALRVKLLGTKHLDTLQSMNNLANMLRRQGRYDEVVQVYQEALASRDASGTQQLSTLLAINHLAAVLHRLHRDDTPEQIHRRILAIKKITLQTMNDPAEVPRDRVKYDEDDEMHLPAWALQEEVLGTKSLTTSNYFDVLHDSNWARKALSMPKRRSLKIVSIGKEHADPIMDTGRRTDTSKSLRSESLASTMELDGKKFERSVTQTKQGVSLKGQDDLSHSFSTGTVVELTDSEDDATIVSSMSSRGNESSAIALAFVHKRLAAALDEVVGIFTDDDDIRQLLSEALVTDVRFRVSRNGTRLLKWTKRLGHLLLLASSTSAEQKIAKRFLSHKRVRACFDQIIKEITLGLSEEKLQDQEINREGSQRHSQEQVETSASTTLSRETLEVPVAVDPSDEEGDYWDEQQATISDVEAEITFLKSSDTFARFKEDLEDFVRPFENEKMWSKMLWDGDEQVRFELSNNVPGLNSFDKLKLSAENMLGMPVIWWPLRQPRRYLPSSKVRITWICVSQSHVTMCKTASLTSTRVANTKRI